MIPIIKPWVGREEVEAAAETLWSGWIAQGPRVAQFEAAFSERVGAGHGVALSSCTAALHLAVVVAGIGPGDEVVVPSLSFIATANAVRYVGATPVFADVELATQNMTATTIEAVLTPATRAVIVVHQGGTPADLGPIHRLCDPRGVAVIEDAACALGSTYEGVPIGSHSELVAFSFHPRKVITTGEGGMLTSPREDWAARLRRLREHGMNLSAAARHSATAVTVERYLETGYNYRMTDIQAAVGLVQLGRLDAIVAVRRQRAERYRALFREVPGLLLAGDPPYGTTNYQSFWIMLPEDLPVERRAVMEHMLGEGVSSRRGIMACHLEPAYADAPHGALPMTEMLDRRALILPLYHSMTDAEQDQVVRSVAAAAGIDNLVGGS